MAITKKQLLDALDVIREVTDGYVSYSIEGKLENQIVIKYYDAYEDYCKSIIAIGIGNIIENPRVTVLKKDILDAEERLADLRKELAELTQE